MRKIKMMPQMVLKTAGAAVICLTMAMPAQAYDTNYYPPGNSFAYITAQKETKKTLNFAMVHPKRYNLGGYQFSPKKLQELGALDLNGWSLSSGKELTDDDISWSDEAKAKGINSIADFLKNTLYQDELFMRHNQQLWSEIQSMDDLSVRCDGGYSMRGTRLSHSSCLRLSHLVGPQGMRFFIEEGRIPQPLALSAGVTSDPRKLADWLTTEQRGFYNLNVTNYTSSFETKAGAEKYSYASLTSDVEYYGGSAALAGGSEPTGTPGCFKRQLQANAEASFDGYNKVYNEMALPVLVPEDGGEPVLGETEGPQSVLDLSCFDAEEFGDIDDILSFNFNFGALLGLLDEFSSQVCGAIGSYTGGWADDFARITEDLLSPLNQTVEVGDFFSVSVSTVEDAIDDPDVVIDLTTFEITPLPAIGVLDPTTTEGEEYFGPVPTGSGDILDLFAPSSP